MLKGFVGLLDLEQHTARDKKAIGALKNLLAAHTFDYVVFRINFLLTSCEDLNCYGGVYGGVYCYCYGVV